MLHGKNNENVLHKKEHLFPQEKESIVPAMQHGFRAKPLYALKLAVKITGSLLTLLYCCSPLKVKSRGEKSKKNVLWS